MPTQGSVQKYRFASGSEERDVMTKSEGFAFVPCLSHYVVVLAAERLARLPAAVENPTGAVRDFPRAHVLHRLKVHSMDVQASREVHERKHFFQVLAHHDVDENAPNVRLVTRQVGEAPYVRNDLVEHITAANPVVGVAGSCIDRELQL